jgi:hypothetical protein
VSFVELPVGMFNIDPVYGTSTSLMDHARTMELNMDFQNCCYISWRQCGTCWLNERSHEPLHVTNQYIYRYTYNNIEKYVFTNWTPYCGWARMTSIKLCVKHSARSCQWWRASK